LCRELNALAVLLDSNDDEHNAEVARKAARVIAHLYGKADEFYSQLQYLAKENESLKRIEPEA
jgi:hypothetical protein